MAPRETENNAYAKFWSDQQTVLWYVMVFSGVVNRPRFRLTKQQPCTSITLFPTFLCRHCTSRTWKCRISRFVEDVNTRPQLSELWYNLLEFNSKKKFQHLTNWTRWNMRDKVWSSTASLFKWRFRSRHCRCCSSSLFTWYKTAMLERNRCTGTRQTKEMTAF